MKSPVMQETGRRRSACWQTLRGASFVSPPEAEGRRLQLFSRLDLADPDLQHGGAALSTIA